MTFILRSWTQDVDVDIHKKTHVIALLNNHSSSEVQNPTNNFLLCNIEKMKKMKELWKNIDLSLAKSLKISQSEGTEAIF